MSGSAFRSSWSSTPNPVIKEKLDYLGQRIGKEDFVAAVRELGAQLDVPGSLREAGVPKDDFYENFDELAKNSLKGPTSNNPVPVSEEAARSLLRQIFEGK